jgi:hypothetical protein
MYVIEMRIINHFFVLFCFVSLCVGRGVFFFPPFFLYRNFGEINKKNLAILVKFVLTNKYIPNFSQFLCQKNDEISPEKKTLGQSEAPPPAHHPLDACYNSVVHEP